LINSGLLHRVAMSQTHTGRASPVDDVPVPSETASPASRFIIKWDLLWKVLAVLGVLLLVYILIYFGTWLAMLN